MELSEKIRTEQIIERDIYVRQNHYIELLMKNDESFFDELKNYYTNKCHVCGETGLDGLESNDDDEYECPHCEEKFEGLDDLDSEAKEVYEWYAVSKWLAEKLEQIGEVVYETPDSHIWGRTCTGQPIVLDGTIQRVVQSFS